MPKLRNAPVPESMLENGIWVFESHHDESFLMSTTVHSFSKLLFIRAGSGTIELDWSKRRKEKATCVSGDCFLIPSGTKHRIVDDACVPISLYGLAIDPRKILPCATIESFIPAGRVPRQRAALLDVERRMRRLLYLASRETPASTLSAVSQAIEVVAFLSAATESSENQLPRDTVGDVLDEYLIWLRSNFFEQLSVKSAAQACSMSRRSFTEAFRQRTGQSWLRYLNQLRVDHAILMLKETDRSVTAIAFQSGFEELSTFYRVFKRMTSKRPLNFRE